MSRSWTTMRKMLEQDFLCPKLRGRIRYFFTLYRRSHDEAGRFSVYLDGKELFGANSFNSNHYDEILEGIRSEKGVPIRKFDETWNFLYDEENVEIEKEARNLSIEEGVIVSYDVLSAIREYLNADIHDSLYSEKPLIRMFAVLDRRVGKRTLHKIMASVDDQPDWLKVFYRLRLEEEGIRLNERYL